MAHVFDATAASETAALDATGTGEISFTETNVSASTVKGRAVLAPSKAPELAWLRLTGDPGRVFPPNGTQTFVVKIGVPAGTKPSQYGFRLDAVSVERPDEDFTQGPTVAISVPLAPPPKPFPWWIIAVAVLVLPVVAALVLWLRPDNTVPVVGVTKKNLSEASQILAQNHLKVGTIRLVLGSPSDVDVVQRQDPLASTKVAPDSAVNFDVGVAVVPIPPLIGKTLSDAQKALADAHLDLGNVTQVNRPGVTVAGQVLDATPKDGMAKSHDKVDPTVQQGTVPVPTLTGQTLPSALGLLAASDLALGEAVGSPWTFTGFVPRPAIVVDQAPRPADVPNGIPVGSKVRIIFPGAPTTLSPWVTDSIRRDLRLAVPVK